jgi:error-prone DNA polymerase
VWEFGKLKYPIEPLDLIYPPDDIEFDEMTSEEVVQTEYEIMGLSLQKPPLSFYRSKLNKLGILDSQNLASYPDGIRVKVAGLQVVRQSPPTAKGVVFLTLEDEFGFINIVLYPHIYTEYVNLIRQRGMLVIEGEIQHQDEVVNVVGYRMRPL